MNKYVLPNYMELLGQPESNILEYKAVLIPSRGIAKIISAFANAQGGYLVMGVKEKPLGGVDIIGLSQDFHANAVIHKALEYLSPTPTITYKIIVQEGKTLYIIGVEKSNTPILFEGAYYIRENTQIKIVGSDENEKKPKNHPLIISVNTQMDNMLSLATSSLVTLIKHFKGILKLFDDLSSILSPLSIEEGSIEYEGKALSRILYSSCIDAFELYLSDLLYEIYLSKPETMKTEETVTLKEILNCSDMIDFINYYAKKKILKLQRGSIRGFIKENKQISSLNAIKDNEQNEIEKILQIRHLYTHRNGIVDEKFLQYFPGEYAVNEEHVLSTKSICDKLSYILNICCKLDAAAKQKFNLSSDY